MKYEITNFESKKVGTIELSDEIFGVPERRDILHRVVNWQLAKRRAGTHKTKGVSDISGTTRKPWRQKGTGRARAGSLRSPQFRGGAVIFGPVVRDHAYKLPKKVRALGLKAALSAKLRSGELIIVESFDLAAAKTKELLKKLTSMGVKSGLFVDGDEVNQNFAKAAMNLIGVDVLPHQGLNVYDILRREKLVLTKAAIELLEKRLK